MRSKKSREIKEKKTSSESNTDWKTLWPHLAAPIGIALLLFLIYG
jgi:hypothetical protein